MTMPPEVLLVALEYGDFPAAAKLNPKIRAGSPLLRATLDIRWSGPEAARALGRAEQHLLSVSPTFLRHQCRGPHEYHVSAGAVRRRADGNRAGPAPRAAPASFDAGLALAHLIEHAVIDFECAILPELDRCSGVTGAWREPEGRFDVMVECPDREVGRFCLALAIAAMRAAANGSAPALREPDLLAAARLAWRRRGSAFNPATVAGFLGWTRGAAARVLGSLKDLGFLDERRYSVNISGLPEYVVATASAPPADTAASH